MCPLCYNDPLPNIDRCHDIYFVKCSFVIDFKKEKTSARIMIGVKHYHVNNQGLLLIRNY